ncbi:MAG: hydantoinase B/oxoprolinase family protein [Chloroflexi bacterium]|nr:hydantoinase B/oxoprolinase family protein [Chloroflexota bacterium]
MSSDFDPILLEVLWNRLLAIAEEQAQALFHSAFNTAVGEAEDFASTILDVEGNLLAQSVSTGTLSMLTGMAKSAKHVLKQFPTSELAPGDAIICNDPWIMSGHKFDVTMISPVFNGSRLVAFTATSIHVTDIGGIGFSASSKDTYYEGLTIPPLKFMERGKPNSSIVELIRHNVRFADQVIGDLLAQTSANEVGALKILEFIREYSLSDLRGIAREVISLSEKAVRNAISRLPAGTYAQEVYMDGFEEPLRIAVALSVDGSEIIADFAGTAKQVPYGINCPLNVSYGYTAHAIKSAMVPEVPNNEGFFRPIKVCAPAGSLLNPLHPAPVMARHLLYTFVSAAVFGALAKVIPDRVIAESGNYVLPSIMGTDDRGQPFAYWFATRCGMGARPGLDGYSGTNYPASVGTVPIEIVEKVSPVFVLCKGFVPDSGGPGKHRGGCDQEITFRVRSDQPIVFSAMFERTRFPAQGYLGGREGGPSKVLVNGLPVASKGSVTLQPGDRVTASGGGGGGFYPPEERDPRDVLLDVECGLVSTVNAAKRYRVSISGNDDDGFTVDWDKTEKLRNRPGRTA